MLNVMGEKELEQRRKLVFIFTVLDNLHTVLLRFINAVSRVLACQYNNTLVLVMWSIEY